MTRTQQVQGIAPRVSAGTGTQPGPLSDAISEPDVPNVKKNSDNHLGVMVNDHPWYRSEVAGIGGAIMIGGAVAAALLHSPIGVNAMAPTQWKLAAAGAAIAGAGLVFLGTRIKPDVVPYMTELIDDREDASAIAGSYGYDVAIHDHGRDKYGLVPLKGKDVDNKGAGEAQLGNIHVDFDAIATRDGDILEYRGTTWVNTGALANERVDVAAMDGDDMDEVAKLEDLQIGTTAGHDVLRLGSPISPDGGFDSRVDAEQWAFEKADQQLGVIQVGDKYHVFELEGPAFTDVLARGTQLKTFSSLTVVGKTGAAQLTEPGKGFSAHSIQSYNVPELLGSADNAKALIGKRVGVSGNDIVRVGQVEKVFDNQTEAEHWAFEDEGHHLLVAVGGKTISYALARDVLASDAVTLLGPDSSVRLIGGDDTFGVRDRSTRPIPKYDISGWKQGDAHKLEGLKLANGVRVGKLESTYDSEGAAEVDLFDKGIGERILASFGGKTFVYSTSGSGAFSKEAMTLLPDSSVGITHLDRTYTVGGRAGSRIPTIGLGGVATSNAGSLVGQRIGMSGGSILHISSLREVTGASADDAYKHAYDLPGEQLVLRLSNGYGIYDIQGGSIVGNSVVSRLDGTITAQRDKKVYAASGYDWSFLRRSIPFSSSEPLGHSLSEFGAARSVVTSRGSASSAIDYIVDNVRSGRNLGIVEGTSSDYWIYELSGSGPGWDEQLGDITGTAHWNQDDKTEYDEHRTSPQNWSSAYVDRLEYHREWVTLERNGSQSTENDTGWDLESRSRDGSRTSALQSELHAEYERILEEERRREEERKRAEEEQRRREEEQRQQQQQQQNNGGSSGGYSGGNSGGSSGGSSGGYSGGNTGGDSGGGYGGGNTEPDW